MRTMIGLAAALCLAACSERPPDRPAAKGPAQQQASANLPDVSGGIPASFHGRWAATQKDCGKAGETGLDIAAYELHFYESSGQVTSVKATGPDEIHIVVALSGEGSLSQRTFRYRLIEGGSALFDVRSGLQRQRCG